MGFELVTQLAETGQRPSSHSSVYGVWIEHEQLSKLELARHASLFFLTGRIDCVLRTPQQLTFRRLLSSAVSRKERKKNRAENMTHAYGTCWSCATIWNETSVTPRAEPQQRPQRVRLKQRFIILRWCSHAGYDVRVRSISRRSWWKLRHHG